MIPDQLVPNRKLVVFPPREGIFEVMYGPIINPVEGNYSTGSIDSDNSRPLTGNPEPNHCRWQYWESGLDKGGWLVPGFHCLQVFGAWWVVEVDQVRSVAQQVAALDFADNPDHNFGIHSGRKPSTLALRMTIASILRFSERTCQSYCEALCADTSRRSIG